MTRFPFGMRIKHKTDQHQTGTIDHHLENKFAIVKLDNGLTGIYDEWELTNNFDIVSSKQENKCECGAHSIGMKFHSEWCSLKGE